MESALLLMEDAREMAVETAVKMVNLSPKKYVQEGTHSGPSLRNAILSSIFKLDPQWLISAERWRLTTVITGRSNG